MLTRQRLIAHAEFGRGDGGVDERHLTVGRRHDDAGTVRRHPVRVPEERGARGRGREPGAAYPLAVASHRGDREGGQHERQTRRVQRRDGRLDEADDVADAGGLGGTRGCRSTCHGLLLPVRI